jgi:hypothetical protein
MFIDSTAYLLQSPDGRVVILVYRGTTPESAINWLTDIDVNPESVRIEFHDQSASFRVHRGFHRNLLATFDAVLSALSRALSKQSVALDANGEPAPMPEAMRALYITGHSLGAAMAAMAALLLRTDRPHQQIFERLRAVYTFGQPMIGDHKLAAVCDDPDVLGTKVIRYVFGHDAAAQLPPTASGDFAHFGREFRHPSTDTVGGWRESNKKTRQMHNLFELAVLIPSFLARQLRATRHLRFGESLDDHLPQHYIAALAGDVPAVETPSAGRRSPRRSLPPRPPTRRRPAKRPPRDVVRRTD